MTQSIFSVHIIMYNLKFAKNEPKCAAQFFRIPVTAVHSSPNSKNSFFPLSREGNLTTTFSSVTI